MRWSAEAVRAGGFLLRAGRLLDDRALDGAAVFLDTADGGAVAS